MNDDRYLWDGSGAPDPDVARLEKLLRPYRLARRRRPWRAWLVAAAAFLCVAGPAWWGTRPDSASRWDVVFVRADDPDDEGHEVELRDGSWIETHPHIHARVRVADIGEVVLGGETRLRLGVSRPDEHRLELARGSIEATIIAPPRLFFVDTPAATAIDLGCAYRLEVDEAGNGRLDVTSGFVELVRPGAAAGAQSDGTRPDGTSPLDFAYVPRGASCPIDAEDGPGIPYFRDAPPNFVAALERLEADLADDDAIATLCEAATAADTLSLWHGLPRFEAADRGRVLDAIARVATLPEDYDRERTVALDPAALLALRGELELYW